ncbi:MAG: hypothetical protein ABI910_15575 [Gemmatimonadota bacterium]
MAINAISSSLNAIQRQSASMDRAAEKIARATTANVSEAPTNAKEAAALATQETGLLDGTVDMMVSKRMFTAALRMASAANEGITDALRMGGYDSAQAA